MSQQITLAVRVAIACDPVTVKQAESAISEGRMSLMLDAPFYGALALRLMLVANPIVSQGTAATDGRSLFYNPEWIVSLTHKKLVGLLAHEVMHIALKHTLRREGRNPRDWNIACDHAINNDLLSAGYELPDDGFADSQFRGWSAEEIFPHVQRPEGDKPPTGCGGFPLPKNRKEDGKGAAPGDAGDTDSGEDDSSNSAPGGDGDEERLPAGGVLDSPDPVGDEAQIDVAIIEAGMCAKAAGNLPAHLGALVKSLTRAKVNFVDLLSEFLIKNTADDYSFSRPNRRYLQAGVYLPTLKSEGAPEIAFFIDNSGSINTDQLSLAVNALDDCIQQVQPERVHAMACDTEVNWRKTFERGERIKVDVEHGGGTDFNPPFDTLEAEGIEPACALYFTDGCGRYPEREPPYPVLWMMTCDHHPTPPWGQVIRVSDVRRT
jgi:predicted metal-dependent peptidase